jgi:hypothetical protein
VSDIKAEAYESKRNKSGKESVCSSLISLKTSITEIASNPASPKKVRKPE